MTHCLPRAITLKCVSGAHGAFVASAVNFQVSFFAADFVPRP